MHTLEPELRLLHAEAAIDDATAARALARDTRQVFSLHYELRGVLYAGVLLVLSGVGIVLARNLDQIGPSAIVLAMALAATACAVPAIRAKLAAGPVTTAGEYLLLLGALLLSADVGYAEHEYALLGPYWSSHLLMLAIVHAVVAHTFRSPLILSVSIAALASWFGVGVTPGDALHFLDSTPALGAKALACAATIATWRFVDRRSGPETSFGPVFEHFAVNLSAWGLIAWCLDWPWVAAGLALLGVLGYVAIRRGLESGREAFLVYGTVYPAIGLCAAIGADTTGRLGVLLAVVCIAATTLWQLRSRLRSVER